MLSKLQLRLHESQCYQQKSSAVSQQETFLLPTTQLVRSEQVHDHAGACTWHLLHS